MGEKTVKPIGKLKIGLVSSGIVIVVLAGLNIWFYMNKTSLESQLKEKWNAYDNYVATHYHTDSEYNNLNSTYNSLVLAYNNYIATHSHTNSEYDALKSERDTLRAPNLIKVAWNEVDDHHGNWHLHVSGAVVNVGTYTAYNSRIHVVCYQGSKVGLDTYYMLYAINGETSELVNEDFYYANGSGLTDWSVTLEWG